MKLRTINYCFKQGVINLFKNRLMTMASISTIGACLFILGVFYLVIANVNYTIFEAETKIGISVFMDSGLNQNQKNEIENKLKNNNDIKLVKYISAEQAWKSFKKSLGKEFDLLDVNPLQESDNFQVFLKNINKQDLVVEYIQKIKGVREIKHQIETTEIIKGLNRFINYIGIVLISILIIISVFLISNTVRMAISIRKNEINIMKYLGAKDFFIEFPFIIEGVIIGIIGASIPLVIIYNIYYYVINKINNEFELINQMISYKELNEIYQVLIPLTLFIGVGIGIIGSKITIRKHLKV